MEEVKIFKKEYIFLNMDLKTKDEVLKFLSNKAMELKITDDKEEIYRGLQEREEEFTTNLGEYFAIPHTKKEAVINPAVIILKLKNKIEWNKGEEKVKLVINLLVPEKSKGDLHIKLLSVLSRKLIHESFKNVLLHSSSIDEIDNLIKNALVIN